MSRKSKRQTVAPNLLATIVESSDDAIISKNLKGVITSWNAGAERIFGYSAAEMVGQSILRLLPPERLEEEEQILRQISKGGRVTHFETVRLGKDGSRIDVSVTISPIRNAAGEIVGASKVARDITARKRAEVSLRRYTERLQNLREIDLEILSARSPAEVVPMILRRLRQMISGRWLSLILFDFESQEAFVFAVEADRASAIKAGLRQPLESKWVTPLKKGEILAVEDILALPTLNPLEKLLIAEGIRSYLNVPLIAQEVLLGIIMLGANPASALESEQIEVAVEVANPLAVALQQLRLYEQLTGARERLESLSRQLLEAQETERRLIAHELHDEIGQSLSMVKVDLQTLQHRSQGVILPASLNESINILDHTLQQVRSLSVELRPSLLDDLGLVPALRWYTDRQGQRGGFTIHFEADLFEARLVPELETVCYRLAQEALTNVVRYAQARQVEVKLRQREHELRLIIRDDGIGFDVAAALAQATHGGSLGLLSMQERALLAGGRLEIESAPRHGTEIRAYFPLKYASPPDLNGGIG